MPERAGNDGFSQPFVDIDEWRDTPLPHLIDNSNFLAAQTYHRHQVPGPEYTAWDQFRDADGTPACPQRPFLAGPVFTAGAAGHVPTGRFTGKMILVGALLDREAFPWQADWYRAQATGHFEADTDAHFRIWYVDNALHGDDSEPTDPTHCVAYLGVLHEALRQLADWVEKGAPPAASTCYTIRDGQVLVPERAADRHGVQPVARLTVDGSARTDIAPHAEAVFEVAAEVPPGTGTIVRAAWDLDGDGTFEHDEPVDPAPAVTLRRTHRYDTLGTRFATVRISSQRDGDQGTVFARIDNLARVRVVVR